jgi:hypothetical protein
MATKFSSVRLHLSLVAAALLLGGCASMPAAQPDSKHATKHSRNQREKQMKLAWIGHSYQELIQMFGNPGLIMNVAASRPWKVSVVVYEGLDTTSGCIDAFTVMHDKTPMVDDYFCN